MAKTKFKIKKFKIQGTDSLNTKLRNRLKGEQRTTIVVGYTANYAIYVHEMVGANFKTPGTQAKFLEQPFREKIEDGTVRRIVGATIENGGNFVSGLLLAALHIQRASQKICPLDTGNLKASAFTRKLQ